MAVQRTYGKQAGELGLTVKTFCMVLAEFDGPAIIEAIKEWLRREREFPTPADIRRMITGEKEFDPRIYQRILNTQRTGQSLVQWEWDYLKGYEESRR